MLVQSNSPPSRCPGAKPQVHSRRLFSPQQQKTLDLLATGPRTLAAPGDRLPRREHGGRVAFSFGDVLVAKQVVDGPIYGLLMGEPSGG